jgi:phosphate-selective porin OprO/OprP
VGNESGPLATLRTVGQTTFFSYNSGVVAAGQRFRYSPQTYFYHGPFGLLAEFVQNSQQVRLAKMSERISDQAWQIAASYLLTGDDASYTGVKPRHNFDPFTGGWGAVEVAARVSNLGVDRDAFTNHFAELTTSSRDAFEWGFGLNWYLNSNFKFQADYIRTSFNRGGINAHNRKDESAVLTRAQVAF